ncbi:hypothetical protein B0H14DRAFT_3428811 [Mycena olivaceomarginata]|nr:hypothetical protein B0H14DRAFT_3428811 [Mycena olivaceomarginata]
MECAIAAPVVSGTRADDEVTPSPTATPVTALRSEARIHPTPHPQCPSPALPLPPSLSSSVSHNPSSPCAPTATPRPRSPHPAVEEESAVDASSSESSRVKPIRASDSDQSLLAFLLQYLRRTTVLALNLRLLTAEISIIALLAAECQTTRRTTEYQSPMYSSWRWPDSFQPDMLLPNPGAE